MKLIICDMSGIASTRGINNDNLLDTLNNLKNYNCTFCTGKGYQGGYETLKNIDLKVPFICENGSVIVDKKGKVIYNDKMNYNKVKSLIYKLNEMPYEFLAYVDLKSHKYKFLKGSKKLTENLTQPWFYSEEIYDNITDFLNNIDKENICRITTRGLELDKSIDELKDFHVVVSENEFHSICNKGTNKGFGVKKLAEICNVDLKDIIIIGNDLNDVDMFKLDCGYKIATGENLPPKELMDLADIYVKLDDLPNFLVEIDKKIIYDSICVEKTFRRRIMENIILTGDRPTGRLHLGHLVGSLSQRVQLQNSGKFDQIFIEIADAQATTDNSGNIQKVKDNVIEVALDYLSCGIDPSKSTIFLQSEVPELSDLTFYYMNLVTLARLERNPTVKQEITYRGFDNSIPVGFLTYPISQAADITAFNANIVPVGDDQLPMIEQTREIVRTFNRLYGETLVEPQAVLPQNVVCQRLPGTDGQAKMSKSIGNCIYLADSPEEVRKKVMSMYTDPNHLKVSDPGNTKDNPVFIYLDAFAKDKHFAEYFMNKETGELEYKNLEELKAHYERGGLGDMKVKKFLNYVLEDTLAPIRARRHYYEQHIPEVYQILFDGSDKARKIAAETLQRVKRAIGLDYRNDIELINDQCIKYGSEPIAYDSDSEKKLDKKTG